MNSNIVCLSMIIVYVTSLYTNYISFGDMTKDRDLTVMY